MYKGLVISGGSFKGISALGSLEYFEEKNLLKDIHSYAGTSVGGLIVILLACGLTPFEIFAFIYSENQLLDVVFTKKSLSSKIQDISESMGILRIYETFTYKVEEFILKKLGVEKVPTLQDVYDMFGKELFLVTTKENKYGVFEKVILNRKTFPRMSIIRACEMSANIPWMFCKLKENGEDYIDGSFSDDFPFELLKSEMNEGEKILSIFIEENSITEKSFNPLSYMFRLISHPIHQKSLLQIKHMSLKDKENLLILNVEVDDPSNFDLSKEKRMQYFLNGYKQAERHFTLE